MHKTISKSLNLHLKRSRGSKTFPCDHFPGLPWFSWWLRSQLNHQPNALFNCVPAYQSGDEEAFGNILIPLYSKVSHLIVEGGSRSIDSIVQTLLEDGDIIAGEDYQHLDSAVDLVFSIVGWQTMLYRPDLLSCPPSEVCIADEMEGYRGEGHMCLKQDRVNSSKCLADFLLGFGLMIPPRNYHALEDPEEIKVFDRLKAVEPSTLNVHLLTTIGGVNIKWTDSLACHLELDADVRTLYLYRYPSFCFASLVESTMESKAKSVIHSCGTGVTDNHHWGTAQDVTELLKEVILSYRLLFGQHDRSRKFFKGLYPFEGVPPMGRDRELLSLCGHRDFQHRFGILERDSYELARDFPHLRTRLVRLSFYLNQRKPRSWKELWLDNRDSASWLTFWAVIIIGGLGLLLAFVQVVLQVVQLSLQVG
ncbi:hypothetical protein F4780DRAFT_600813 [Xylariomycetidae sp. FL0641]|nr:hypothetical protein F4780DRAFT_600813 [Xylariomycetidae sp. FL0641]